ncbi:MAG: SIS domain-containing protein [Candidatus Omnitrophica bacterium]|nr:SIS domain-containing protein [Candidatus Omnitrophota bacterium]
MTKKIDRISEIIGDSITTKAFLLYDKAYAEKIEKIALLIVSALKKGNKILIFGNGGSAGDSQHFAAELVGRFQKERKGLAALALSTDTSSLTALSNDYSFDIVFKRQIEALGRPGDIAFAISTSGNAKNILEAVRQANKMKLKTIGLTGKKGGGLSQTAGLSLIVPSNVTARIQESHILIIHILCELIEDAFNK